MELNPDVLYRNSHRLVSQVSLDFKREIYDINWSPRIIGIKGPKDVGKSTLLKQHIKESFTDDTKNFYRINSKQSGERYHIVPLT